MRFEQVPPGAIFVLAKEHLRLTKLQHTMFTKDKVAYNAVDDMSRPYYITKNERVLKGEPTA